MLRRKLRCASDPGKPSLLDGWLWAGVGLAVAVCQAMKGLGCYVQQELIGRQCQHEVVEARSRAESARSGTPCGGSHTHQQPAYSNGSKGPRWRGRLHGR